MEAMTELVKFHDGETRFQLKCGEMARRQIMCIDCEGGCEAYCPRREARIKELGIMFDEIKAALSGASTHSPIYIGCDVASSPDYSATITGVGEMIVEQRVVQVGSVK